MIGLSLTRSVLIRCLCEVFSGVLKRVGVGGDMKKYESMTIFDARLIRVKGVPTISLNLCDNRHSDILWGGGLKLLVKVIIASDLERSYQNSCAHGSSSFGQTAAHGKLYDGQLPDAVTV
ncbi:unnamed protein product [Phytophthora fragariaefolia]|uniref:Unnamed protein product n=1 Tax=Phytophthora fragariaefolia TaxID=1490495 RepID=A0A9W6XQV2_9STRA|nr:unnamed protein product [Phytophthora fragariaefolia]